MTDASQWTTPSHRTFAAEIEADGRWTVEEYTGRNFYVGPAVIVPADDLQAVIRATTGKLQWDAMGRDNLVVYPT